MRMLMAGVMKSDCELHCRWTLANSQKGTETLSPTAHGELNPANVNLEVDSSPIRSPDGTPALVNSLVEASWEILKQGPQLSQTWNPDPPHTLR